MVSRARRSRAQPIRAPTSRIDHREPTMWIRSTRCREPPTEIDRPRGECLAQQLPICANPSVVVGGLQDQEAGRHRSWAPTESPGRVPRLAFIPAQRSLNPTHVVDLGLELDAEQAPIRGPVCEKVDPAAIATASDLDFRLDLPAVAPQVPRGVRGAAGVYEIVLFASSDKPERGRVDRQADSQEAKRRRGQANVEARADAGLQPGDSGLGGAQATGEFGLGPARSQSCGPDRAADQAGKIVVGRPKRGQHRQ